MVACYLARQVMALGHDARLILAIILLLPFAFRIPGISCTGASPHLPVRRFAPKGDAHAAQRLRQLIPNKQPLDLLHTEVSRGTTRNCTPGKSSTESARGTPAQPERQLPLKASSLEEQLKQ